MGDSRTIITIRYNTQNTMVMGNATRMRKDCRLIISQNQLPHPPHFYPVKERDLPINPYQPNSKDIPSTFCVFPISILRPFFELGHTKQLARPDSTVGIHLPHSAWLREWVQCRSPCLLLRPKTRLSHPGYTNLCLKILLILRPVLRLYGVLPLMRNH